MPNWRKLKRNSKIVLVLDKIIFQNIETQRLLLRKIKKSDYKDIFELYSKKEIIRFTDNAIHESENDSKKMIAEFAKLHKQNLQIAWGITLKPYNKISGVIKIYHIDFYHRFGSLGNLLDNNFWNKGIMTEAQKVVCDFGFKTLNLHRLEAQVFIKNTASVRTFEKLNFKLEGTLSENFKIDNKFESSFIFSLLNPY